MIVHGLDLHLARNGKDYTTTLVKGVMITFSHNELNGRWYAHLRAAGRPGRALEPLAQADTLEDCVLLARKIWFKSAGERSRARRPLEARPSPVASPVEPQGEKMRRRRHNPRQLIVAENSRFATINLAQESSRGFEPVAMHFTGDAEVESKGWMHKVGPSAIEVSIPTSVYTQKGVDDPATLVFTIEMVEEDVVGLTWRIVADESILLEDE